MVFFLPFFSARSVVSVLIKALSGMDEGVKWSVFLCQLCPSSAVQKKKKIKLKSGHRDLNSILRWVWPWVTQGTVYAWSVSQLETGSTRVQSKDSVSEWPGQANRSARFRCLGGERSQSSTESFTMRVAPVTQCLHYYTLAWELSTGCVS